MLYRRLTTQPRTRKPELGKLRSLPHREQKQFFQETQSYENEGLPESQTQSLDIVPEEELLNRYLHWFIEQNRELELPGLPGGKYHPVELETVYVALRGDLSNPYKREQSQVMLEQQARQLENLLTGKELTPEQQYKVVNQIISLIARAPVPISIEERDRPHLFHRRNERTITLGEAVQQERKLVILGDPGSGKITLCRWFAIKLARAYLQKEEEVWVPVYHVNPAADAAIPNSDFDN